MARTVAFAPRMVASIGFDFGDTMVDKGDADTSVYHIVVEASEVGGRPSKHPCSR